MAAAAGRTRGADSGATGDGGRALVADIGLFGLGLLVCHLCPGLPLSSLEEACSSLSSPRASTSPSTTLDGKIGTGPTLHQPAKLGVTPTSSISSCSVMSSSSLPYGLSHTSPGVGQGGSCDHNALLADRV